MSLQNFKQEVIDHFTDEEHLVTVAKDPGHWSDGNSLLNTALFYTILSRSNSIFEGDRLRFTKAVENCWVRHKGRIVEGLLNRNLNRPDFEGHDDYHITTASCLLNTYHREAIYNYGNDNDWSFNNEKPYCDSKFSSHYWRGWHGRFTGRVGYYALAATQDPGVLQNKLIVCDINSGPSDDSASTMMQWLRIQVYKDKSSKFVEEIKRWEDRFVKKYGDLTTAMTPYYKQEHPFSKYKISVYGTVS